MARNEHGFWTALRKRLADIPHEGHFVRVENGVGPGTPDLNYCFPTTRGVRAREGWLELKCIERWPRSEVVKIDHYTPEQRMWMTKRFASGGDVWLLLKVEEEDEYYLLWAQFCITFLGRCPKEQIRSAAALFFVGLTESNVRRLLEKL